VKIVGSAAASTPVVVLQPGPVLDTAASLDEPGMNPTDGRLRGPDFTADVSRVAWPQRVQSASGALDVAGTGDRLVTFTLSVTQPSAESGSLSQQTGVSGWLQTGVSGASVHTMLPFTRIDDEIAGGTSGSAETTGTDTFVGSVPASEQRSVALVLSAQGFSQALNLWRLARVPPEPIVLYRDRSTSTVTGKAASSFNVAFTNSADGFSSSDDAQVSSATLGYFAPGSPAITPDDPNQAFLTVSIQSSYPSVPYGEPDSGHFFSSFTPLPGSRLTFTPTGGTAVAAMADTADFSSTSAAGDDDGIFDALYTFAVPATTTTGTLTVTPGSATGTEYTGFTGSGNAVPIDISAPATVALTFPPVPEPSKAQRKAPWVGSPLPATGLAAAGASGSANGLSAGSPSGGFPIWLAVLIVVLLGAAAVLIQRHRRRSTPFAVTVPGGPVSASSEESPPARASTPFPPVADSATEPVSSVLAVDDQPAPEADECDTVDDPPSEPVMVFRVLGPPEIVPAEQAAAIPPGALTELAFYLALHRHRHLRVGEIQIGLSPLSAKRPERADKTVQNNMSSLRRIIGAGHLPEAGNKGYLLEGVTTDWDTFVALTRQADATAGPCVLDLRSEAISLVRGRPFQGSEYPWVEAEQLESQMTVAVLRCAQRLLADLRDVVELDRAEDVSRRMVAIFPEDVGPWELGATVLAAKGDRSAVERWLRDATHHIDETDICRIREGLADASGD
jgi:DNA-binding SARP family transcriptional activator